MKYIIDDKHLEALTKGEACSLTQVPELPVKRWEDIDRSMYGLQKDCMAHEIKELRALCQAQAATIERMAEPVELGGLCGNYEFRILKDGTPQVLKLK